LCIILGFNQKTHWGTSQGRSSQNAPVCLL